MSQNDWDHYYSTVHGQTTTTNGQINFDQSTAASGGCVTYDLSTGSYTSGGQTSISPMAKLEAQLLEGVRAILKDLEDEADRLGRDWDGSFIDRTLRDMKADAFDQIKLLVKVPTETEEDEL